MTRLTLGLTGAESFDIPDIVPALHPGGAVPALLHRPNGETEMFNLMSRIDTKREAEWVSNGGILPYVLNQLAAA
ncbi:MAG: hypothetical protein ACRECY_17780, partial [Phyllobacterium sp.]